MKTIIFYFVALLFALTWFVSPSSSSPFDTAYYSYRSYGRMRFEKCDYQKAITNFEAAKLCAGGFIIQEIEDDLNKAKTCLMCLQIAEDEFGIENYSDAMLYYDKVVEINKYDEYCKMKSQNCAEKLFSSKNMVIVKGGEFAMGAMDGESNEQPIHKVALRSFYIDKYEVTNKEFASFLNKKGNQVEGKVSWLHIEARDCLIEYVNGIFRAKAGFENYPVGEVTWYGANAYAKYNGKRLPTEAEWEFAARGGLASRNYLFSGGNHVDSIGWYKENAHFEMRTVGSKKSNELGVYDMSGNAWEWCEDWYSAGYYNLSTEENPEGPNLSMYKVMRGGSGTSFETNLRITYRNFNLPTDSYKHYGFRCVRTIE